MNKYNDIVDWAFQYLKSIDNSPVHDAEFVLETAYSKAYKIKTKKGVLYLKQVPQKLFLEPPTIALIHQHCDANVPEILAVNHALQCFLMTSCGDTTLRTLFNGTAHIDFLSSGISNYVQIQRCMEKYTDKLFTLGLPDWRLNRFPSLYEALIQNEKLLLEDGLSIEELKELKTLNPVCMELCEKLNDFQMPHTIDHCDFHDGNLIIRGSDSSISIIDWGETVITHPFFSLVGCLWNVCYQTGLKPSSKQYHSLRLTCISAWLEEYDEKSLLSAFSLTKKLSGIYAALAYVRMQDATGEKHISKKTEGAGAITGCLRSFLSRDEGVINK